jgi:hypothetical protein
VERVEFKTIVNNFSPPDGSLKIRLTAMPMDDDDLSAKNNF